MSHRITIPTNPANPVNYLACCGLFDLLARMDPHALGWWQLTMPVALHLECKLTEQEFVHSVLNSLGSAELWSFYPTSQLPTRINVRFASPGGFPFIVPLDWWLETAELGGAIRDKSAWKMYAGQQTIQGIVGDMVAEAAKLKAALNPNTTAASFLDQSAEMTGRFGFDPRASRNALDVGFSPNDLQMPVRTFVFTELLAAFGLNSFFPARNGQAGRLPSTRGWHGADDGEGEKGFAYCLWTNPLPVTLARLAAIGSGHGAARRLFAPRAMRKNYSNLTLARTIESKLA